MRGITSVMRTLVIPPIFLNREDTTNNLFHPVMVKSQLGYFPDIFEKCQKDGIFF